MVGGGLMQLVALGMQDVYLTGTRIANCYFAMAGRTYNNFELIFDDTKIGRDIYYSNLLIDVRPIKLDKLNDEPIFKNSRDTIINNQNKLQSILRKEHKLEKEEEKEKKKEERRNHNDCVQFFKLCFKNANQVERAQRKSQNKQMKNQMRRR